MQFKVLVSFTVLAAIYLSSEATANSIETVKFQDNENNLIGTKEVGTAVEPEQFAFAFPEESNFKAQQPTTGLDTQIEVNEATTTTPEGLGQYSDTQPRTFHHIAQKIHFVEAGINSALHKFLSLFFPGNLPQPDYVDYIYRKDGSSPSVQTPALLRPLARIPQYLTNHPINFKKHLSNFHHAISKRSIEDGTNNNQVIEENSDSSDNHPRTLHKIIPNFEANFNHMFRKIFAPTTFGTQPLFQNHNNPYHQEETSKGPSSEYNRQGAVGFTNLMRMLPELFNRRYSSPNYNNEPQDFISTNLRRIMNILRRPLISSSQNHSSR